MHAQRLFAPGASAAAAAAAAASCCCACSQLLRGCGGREENRVFLGNAMTIKFEFEYLIVEKICCHCTGSYCDSAASRRTGSDHKSCDLKAIFFLNGDSGEVLAIGRPPCELKSLRIMPIYDLRICGIKAISAYEQYWDKTKSVRIDKSPPDTAKVEEIVTSLDHLCLGSETG